MPLLNNKHKAQLESNYIREKEGEKIRVEEQKSFYVHAPSLQTDVIIHY